MSLFLSYAYPIPQLDLYEKTESIIGMYCANLISSTLTDNNNNCRNPP